MWAQWQKNIVTLMSGLGTLCAVCRGRCWLVSSCWWTEQTSTSGIREDRGRYTLLPPLDTPGITHIHSLTIRSNSCKYSQLLFIGCHSQVCLLLKRGANQYAVDERGQDPLAIAVETAHADIVTLWVLSYHTIGCEVRWGWSCVHSGHGRRSLALSWLSYASLLCCSQAYVLTC